MKYNTILIASLCLFASSHAYSAAGENTRSSGWYVGASTSVANTGGSVSTTSNGDIDETFDIDTVDSPVVLKAGYVTESENRIEIYYKKDSISWEDSSESIDDVFKTSSLGINYQWGISSLSTDKMLPYIRVGGAVGSAEFKDSSADLTAVELDLGVGIHYEVTDNIDLSAGIYRRAVMVGNDSDDETIGSAINGAELGVNYHFLNMSEKGSSRVH